MEGWRWENAKTQAGDGHKTAANIHFLCVSTGSVRPSLRPGEVAVFAGGGGEGGRVVCSVVFKKTTVHSQLLAF